MHADYNPSSPPRPHSPLAGRNLRFAASVISELVNGNPQTKRYCQKMTRCLHAALSKPDSSVLLNASDHQWPATWTSRNLVTEQPGQVKRKRKTGTIDWQWRPLGDSIECIGIVGDVQANMAMSAARTGLTFRYTQRHAVFWRDRGHISRAHRLWRKTIWPTIVSVA